MANLFCTGCGEALEVGDAFCASCGTPVKHTPFMPNKGSKPPVKNMTETIAMVLNSVKDIVDDSPALKTSENEAAKVTVSKGHSGMKTLVCEMCGGNDLVKQDGLFVCQNCRTKYSVEDARKMMVEIEGPIDVSGSTVKIDTSDKLKNLYELARRARKDVNAKKASQYYEQIAMEDPRSWEAAFFSVYFSALQKYKGNDSGGALDLIKGCLDSVFDLIDKIQDPDEKAEAFDDVEDHASELTNNIWEQAYIEHKNVKLEVLFDNSAEAGNYKRASAEVKGFVALSAAHIYDKIADRRCAMFVSEESTKLTKATWELAKTLIKDESERVIRSSDRRARVEALDEKISSLEKVASKRRFDEYWDEHQNEKTELESSKQSLTEQIDVLNEEIDNVIRNTEGYPTMLELQRKASKLEEEKNSLGVFKFKEKKAVQEHIDAVQNQIAPIQTRIDTAVNAAKQRIAPLQKAVNEIDNELTMPR